MLPGNYDQNTDVRDLDTYAIVNNIRREIVSVDLDGELSGDLPDQVVAAGGLAGRAGTIVWATHQDAVDHREVSPWHKPVGWPPTGGDRVRVYVTDGTTSWPRFTGVIDRTTGTVGGSYQSTILDDRDRLNRRLTHQALLRSHVPVSEGAPVRRIGLNYWYMVTRALRHAGVYNTPPTVPVSAMSAPMQGSVWPESGTLSASNGTGTEHLFPTFYEAPWGYAAAAADMEYIPVTDDTIEQTLQISFMVADDHAGDAHIRVYYGTNPDHRIRVRIWGNRGVTAYWNNDSIVSLSSTQMSGANIVTLLVKGNTWTLRNDAMREATGTRSRSGTVRMSRIEVGLGDDARIAGVQVQRPSAANEFAQLRFSPSTTFERSFLSRSLDMTPRMDGRNVADLVDEICQATLTASWWDESGVLRMVASDRLYNRNPVQTITTLDDITALTWEDSLLHVRSSVTVTWKDASISRGTRTRQELYRGRSATMEAGDEVEVFAAPDDKTEWFGVDRRPTRLNDSNWGTYNHGTGSYTGVYYVDDDGNQLPTSSNTTTIRLEPLGNVALKIIHIAGNYSAGVEANLKTTEEGPALRQGLRGEPLPVIRGRGKGEWVDEEYVSDITGPSYAPSLTHDLGYWGHRSYGPYEGESAASRIGDYIAEMVTKPHPTVPNIEVTYDPRRQLGDVVTLELGVLDVQLRALIVGVSESHENGAHSQSLKVRIISATSTRSVTYDELEQAWRGGDYSALQAVWANLTYEDFEDEPLRFAPNRAPAS